MMPAHIAVLRAGVLLAIALLPTMSAWAQCMQCENCQAGCPPCLGPDNVAFAGGHPGLAPPVHFGGFEVNARSGPIFGASGGFLKDRMADPGFAIEVTAREPLGPGGCRSKTFFEIGGYFSQIYGDNSLVTTSGTFVNQTTNISTPLDAFFQTNLTQITRSAFQVGIGRRFSPHLLQWVCQRQPACQFDDFLTWRGGLRLGSVNASFDQTPTDALQAMIDAAIAAGQQFQLRDDVEDTDNFLALYTSLGLELLPFRIPVNQCQWIDGRFSIEGIYEHSWFELRNFTPNGSGLGTIGVQAGLNLAW